MIKRLIKNYLLHWRRKEILSDRNSGLVDLILLFKENYKPKDKLDNYILLYLNTLIREVVYKDMISENLSNIIDDGEVRYNLYESFQNKSERGYFVFNIDDIFSEKNNIKLCFSIYRSKPHLPYFITHQSITHQSIITMDVDLELTSNVFGLQLKIGSYSIRSKDYTRSITDIDKSERDTLVILIEMYFYEFIEDSIIEENLLDLID